MIPEDAARSVIMELCDKITDKTGMNPVASKIRLGKFVLDFMKIGTSHDIDGGGQLALIGVPIFCDLEDPLEWRIEMNDGTVRKGDLLFKIDSVSTLILELSAHENNQEQLDYFIEAMTNDPDSLFEQAKMKDQEKK
jgi:hypothetical protein